MKELSAITVDSSMRLSIPLHDSKGTRVAVQMDRIAAQELADALNEYAGRKAKSYSRERSTDVAGTLRVITDTDRLATARALVGKR